MDMRLEYALTADDFCEFQMGYIKHRKSLMPRGAGRAGLAVVFVPLALVVTAIVVLDAFDPAPVPPSPPVTGAAQFYPLLRWGLLLLLVVGFLLWIRYGRWYYRRAASQGVRLGESTVTEISDSQVTIQSPGCRTTMDWAYFIRVIETKRVFVLFIMPRGGHIIPKRAFSSAEQVEEFRRFTAARVGMGTRGFPLQAGMDRQS